MSYTLDSKNENFASALKIAYRKAAIADAITARFLEAAEAIAELPDAEQCGFLPQMQNLFSQRKIALMEMVVANLDLIAATNELPDFVAKDHQASIDKIHSDTLGLVAELKKSK